MWSKECMVSRAGNFNICYKNEKVIQRIFARQQRQSHPKNYTHIYKLLNAVGRFHNRATQFPPGYKNFFINNNDKKVKKHGFI